jgi:hypothetical protein
MSRTINPSKAAVVRLSDMYTLERQRLPENRTPVAVSTALGTCYVYSTGVLEQIVRNPCTVIVVTTWRTLLDDEHGWWRALLREGDQIIGPGSSQSLYPHWRQCYELLELPFPEHPRGDDMLYRALQYKRVLLGDTLRKNR